VRRRELFAILVPSGLVAAAAAGITFDFDVLSPAFWVVAGSFTVLASAVIAALPFWYEPTGPEPAIPGGELPDQPQTQ